MGTQKLSHPGTPMAGWYMLRSEVPNLSDHPMKAQPGEVGNCAFYGLGILMGPETQPPSILGP